MERNIVKIIASNSMIGALYVVLTLVTYPISFLSIQFRLAEILVLLCFFRKDYMIGIADVIFGTLATLVACLGIIFCKQLAIACLFPIVSNAFIVGYILFTVLKRRKNFFEMINTKQNIAFKW